MKSFLLLNKPMFFIAQDNEFRLTTGPNTDFWQHTHYNFAADNGHFIYWNELSSEMNLEATCEIAAAHRYDQAGLMLRGDSLNWLKVSAEWLDPFTCAIGSVNTKMGFSDWASHQDCPKLNYRFRIEIRGMNAYVFYEVNNKWVQQRILDISHIRATGKTLLGLYACSPKGPGTSVHFKDVVLEYL